MKKLILLLCLAAICLCGCATEPVSDNGITTVTLYRDNVLKIKAEPSVFTVDPAYASTGNELLLARLIYSGLFRETAEGITPDLVDKWSRSEDGLSYYFTLKPGVKFSDGSDLTAYDIKFSWERALLNDAPNAYLFENIVGSKAIYSGESKTLSGVVIDSEGRLSVTLKKADDAFLSKLASVGAMVLKRTEPGAHGAGYAMPSGFDKYNNLPSGSGPMRLSEWIAGQNMSLTANDYYYGKGFAFRRLEIDFATSVTDALIKLGWHELDAVQGVTASQLPYNKDDEELASLELKNKSFTCVMLNPLWTNGQVTPLAEASVRLAVLKLLAAENIAQSVTEGTATVNTGITAHWNSIGTSVNISQELMPAGDFPLEIPFPPIPIVCGPSAAELQTAIIIAEKLSEHNIRCEIKQQYYADLQKTFEQGQDFALMVYEYNDRGCGVMDFFRNFTSLYVRYKGEKSELSTLLDEALLANAEKRAELYAKAEAILCREGYLKPLWFSNTTIVYDAKTRNLAEKIQSLFMP